MKRVSYFFYASLFFLIHGAYSADFFHLEHLPQGTKIPVLKLVNLIPAVANTPIKNAELQDVYVQAVTETPAVNAHIEMLGKMKLKTSLPGLQNIGDLDLTFIAKLFSAFGRGAAPVSSQPQPIEKKPIEVADNDLSQAALAIYSEVPKGFTKYDEFEGYRNVYFENVVGKEKYPHMILQVGNKYVMFAPEASDFPLTPQTIQQQIEEMPNTPRWKTLITAPQQTVAQIEREEDIQKTITKGLSTPESLSPARQTFVKRYENAISLLESLPPDPHIQQLLRRLTTERSNLGKPELDLKALTDANTYLKRPEVMATIEQQVATRKGLNLELEQLYKQDIEREKLGIDRPIESVVEEEMEAKSTTAQAPATGTPLTANDIDIVKARFQIAINTLNKKLEYAQQLEKAQSVQPGAVSPQAKIITSLKQQIQALKGEQAYVNAAQKITDKDVRNLQILPAIENETKSQPPPPLIPLTERHKVLNQQYDETMSALTDLSKKDPNALKVLAAVQEEQDRVTRLTSLPETTPATLANAQKYLRTQGVQPKPILTQPVQPQRTTPLTPGEAFEREVGKNERLYREEDPIWKFRIASLPTPAGTAGGGKYVVIASPTGKEYLFDSAKVIGAGLTKEQLEQYVAARETKIAIQQQPLTNAEAINAREQARSALATLKNIPKNFQTPDIKKAISDLENELTTLSSSTPPKELPALAKAKVLIADITPRLPAPQFSTQQAQHFQEITEKAVDVVSSSKLPSGLTPYKNSSILISSQQAAIPVGDKFILLRTDFPIKGFLDSIPLNFLENFGANISRNAQVWQEFATNLHEGKPTTKEDIEAISPTAKPFTGYEAARSKLIDKIDSLNKIINQRTSEITRVGAALFLITLQNPNYRPFQNIQIPDLPPIDVPGIKDIELNNTELGIFLAPPQVFSIWAQGNARVINIPLFAKVLFNYEKMKDATGRMVDNTGVVLQAGLPEAWKFSDSFPEMKDWDRFVIKKAYVYVSTINYIDYSIPTQLMPSASISIANVPGRPTVGMLPGITIRPGLSLYGEINLRKLIPELFEHLNFAGLETASAYGTISHKPENCQIGIGLPDLIKIENSPFKLGGVWAEIHMKNMAVPGAPAPLFKPEASVVVALVIQPSPKDETLTFTARASSDEAGGMVAFSMQGFWNNAFGVEGLSIGDLALQLHTDYKALLAGVPISGGGFTGTFKFGTQEDSTIIKIAALYAMVSTGQEMALQGKLDGTLSIWQIIDGCKSLAIRKAQLDKKPTKSVEENYNKILNNAVAKQLGNVAIRNVEMKVAPSTVRIGEFFILQGFTAKGELTLLGVTAGMDFNLGQSGLTATGYLSPIKIGDVFSLTGAGMDKQYGTADDGALMSLALNFMKQHFIITGQVKLLGIEQQTDIFIDTEGLNCTISGKLFNLFDASVVLKSRGDITNPDLYFKASMKQEFTKYIVDETIKALRASTQDAVNKIKDAQNEVDKINNNIADLDKQIADRKKRIDELTKVAAQAPTTSPEITKLGLELTGLETARIATIGARNDAQKILAGSQDAINKFNAAQQEVNKLNASVADFDNQISSRKRRIDELGKNFLEGIKNSPEITKLGIEVAGLETAKAGTVASRDTATGVLSSLSGTAALISTNQGQIDNLNKEIARLDQQIAEHKQQIDTLSKQFTQGAQTSPEITKLGLELTGLETAKAGAITSRETAKGALEGVKRWVGGASTIAEAFIKGSVPVDIRESTLEASIQDIAKGKLPRFTANVAILGKKLNLDMQLDFSSPDKAQQSANAIAQQILALFK